MIIDRLENWSLYPFAPAWAQVFNFLAQLSAKTAVGEYALQGEDIFARVMSYTTKVPEAGTLETHRRYVDIQTVLVGAEGMEWYPQSALALRDAYDPARDAEFYLRPATALARATVRPGSFVALLPQDAHLFGVVVDGEPAEVKKVVVKMRVELLGMPPC